MKRHILTLLLFLPILFLMPLKIAANTVVVNNPAETEIMNGWSWASDYTINLSTATPLEKITFEATSQKASTGAIELYLIDENDNEYRVFRTGRVITYDSELPTVSTKWGQITKWNYKQCTLSNAYSAAGVDKRTRFKSIRFHATGTLNKWVRNVVAYQASYLETERTLSQTISETNVFETKTLTSAIDLYHSDLNTKLYVNETDASGYFSYTLTDNAPSGPGKFGTAILQISYLPQTAGTHTATFKVTDGVKSKTFTVKGSAKRVNRNINWTINDKLNASEGYFIEAHDVSVVNYVVGSKTYGPWYGISTVDGDKVIEYSSSDNDVLTIVGNNLYPLSAGEVTITAHMPQTDSYNELISTKTITITTKTLQTISWSQSLRYDYPADVNRVIELTATASSGLPITYSIEGDGSIATLSGNKITIRGEGRTNITATQVGNETYEAVSETKRILVRNPNAECEEYALEAPSEVYTINGVLSFDGTEYEYKLNGKPAGTLTFEAKKETFRLVINYNAGNCFVDVESNGTRHKDFYTCSPEVKIGEYQTYSVDIPENTTRLWLTTNIGATGYKYFRNVYVTQATYIRSETPEISYNDYTGVTTRKYFYVNYSNLPNPIEIISPDERYVKPVTEPFGDGCGDLGRKLVAVDVTIPPSFTEKTYTLTLKGGDKPEHILQIPIKLKSIGKGPQAIDWTIYPTLTTASEETVYTLGATAKPSNLDIIYSSENPDVAYIQDGKLVILKEGTVTLTANQPGNDYYYAAEEKTRTFNISVADLTFDNYDGDNNWFNKRNWRPSRVVIPNSISFATLEADVEVSDQAFAKKLMLDGHGVTVKADGSLHAETIVGADTPEPRIILEAGNETKAPGALATKSDNVKANVGIYVKSTTQAENTTWQYMGVPFSVRTVPAFYGAWICEWSEAVGNWSYKTTNDVLEPWKGYCITQPELTMTYGYEINGVVQNSNHTYELTYTESSKYAGDNLMTNSYTAPIDITKLNAEDFVNADKTIYIFNTGSYEQWEVQKGSIGKDLRLAGQYMAIPILEADYTPYGITVIPAMQAFNVHATAENASFTVDYNRAVWGSKATTKPKRAPRRSPADELYDFDENIIIEVHGSRFSDAISVLKRSSCTNAFDNGHDAYKWDGDNSAAPQLFSTEDDEKIYTIDARPELEGHYIGFKGGEDSEYTLYFKLAETDEQYYLKDLADNSYYLIVEGTSVTIDAKEPMNRRFQIVSEISAEDIPQEHTGVTTDLSMNSDMAFLTNNTDYSVYANIYDMSGKLIHQPLVAPHSTLNYELNNLPRGTYIINLGSQNIKVVR